MASPMQDKKYKVTTPFGVKGRMWSSGRHEGVDYAAPVERHRSSLTHGTTGRTTLEKGWRSRP